MINKLHWRPIADLPTTPGSEVLMYCVWDADEIYEATPEQIRLAGLPETGFYFGTKKITRSAILQHRLDDEGRWVAWFVHPDDIHDHYRVAWADVPPPPAGAARKEGE